MTKKRKRDPVTFSKIAVGKSATEKERRAAAVKKLRRDRAKYGTRAKVLRPQGGYLFEASPTSKRKHFIGLPPGKRRTRRRHGSAGEQAMQKWNELPSLNVSVRSAAPDPETGAVGVSIPYRAPREAAEVERIMEELFAWNAEDCAANRDMLDGEPPPFDERFSRFARREIARMSGLVVFLGVADGILRKAQEGFVSALESMDAVAAARIAPDLARRAATIEGLMETPDLFRNKVFAHTSYADPRRDNWSTQLTSLLILGGGLHYLPDGIGLGSMSVVSGAPGIKFPPLSVAILRRTSGDIFREWHESLAVVLRELHALPDSAWTKRYSTVGRVWRSDLASPPAT